MQRLYRSRVRRRAGGIYNKDCGRRSHTDQMPAAGREKKTITRVDEEAIQIKAPHRDERNATITRADADAIQIEGLQGVEKNDTVAIGRRCPPDQRPAEGGDRNNKDSGCRGCTDHGPAEGSEKRQ